MSGRKRIAIEVKFSCGESDLCGICGEPYDAEVGPEAFIAGTTRAVCNACVKKHMGPDARRMMEFAQKAFGIGLHPALVEQMEAHGIGLTLRE